MGRPRQRFRYSPQTGMLYTQYGPFLRDNCKGYYGSSSMGKTFIVHQIAWRLVHGLIPKGMVVDHINRNKKDNRLANLRLVRYKDNSANRPSNKNSKSGWKGVSWHKRQKCWIAQIAYDGKKRYIGGSPSLYMAVLMYNIYAMSLHDPHVYINPLPRLTNGSIPEIQQEGDKR